MNRDESRAAPGAADYAVLIGAQLAVGSAALMARAGLAAGLSPLALSAWRLTIASAILLLLRSGRRSAPVAPLSSREAARLLAAGICLGLHFATWFASLQLVPVASSTLLVNTSPIWTGIAAGLFLKRRLPVTFWIGVAIAVPGAYLVVATPGALSGSHASPRFGDGLAVAGAIFIAAYLLLVQDLIPRLGTNHVVAWTYTTAAVSLWPVTLLAGPSSALPRSAAAWLAVIGMALVPQLMGHTAMNWSLRRFSAGVVAATTLLEPVFAAALAWWLLAEPLTARQGIGACILLLGVGLALAPREEDADRKVNNISPDTDPHSSPDRSPP